jgi:TetR/AcrR family transcriptional repressor of mexJK operon
LAVAWQVFLEYGYAGASMSDIAERLGGSKGTLYNYFSSKEELFLATAREKGDELYRKLEDLPRPKGDLTTDLTDFGCRMLAVVASEEYLAFYRLIIAEATRVPVIGRMAYDSRRSTMLAPIAERIEEEMKAGRVRLADPLEAAEVFWDLCSASFQRRSLLAVEPALTDTEIRNLVNRAVAIFVAAYGTG